MKIIFPKISLLIKKILNKWNRKDFEIFFEKTKSNLIKRRDTDLLSNVTYENSKTLSDFRDIL